MAHPEHLHVYLNDQLVGALSQVGTGLVFAYDREWLDCSQSAWAFLGGRPD